MQHTERTLWDAVEPDELLPRSLGAMIRAAYFSNAGEAATRYRVGVSEVIAHLIPAGILRMPRPTRAAENMACVVHAVALVRGDAQAWADIVNQLASSFDRACAARLDPVRGIAFSRRFWLDLRSNAGTASRNHGTRAPNLRAYPGNRPLRYWLAERLLGSLEFELGRASHTSAPRLDRGAVPRTLRIPRAAVLVEAKAR
ncbi:MAG: hypothetical protein JNK53_08555 [Phycisphaerae bacterium]|nr:hypothetical protein [Phycisphaerae bacterium]